MRSQWKLWSGYLGIVFLLASCAPTAHVEKDDNVDFSQYRTFAWAEKDKAAKKDRNGDLAEQKIREAVTQELVKSGWRESKRNPDALLSYDVLVERSVRSQNDPVYSRPFVRTFYNPASRRFFNVYYPSQFMGYDNYQVPSREGTVTISVIDANTEKVVWQGWATDEINGRHMTTKEIQNVVKAIFRKFDIAKN